MTDGVGPSAFPGGTASGPLRYLLDGHLVLPSDALAGAGVSVDRALRVLLYLADHYNDATGECHPGVTRLAHRTGLHKSRMYDALTALEAVGLIQRRTRSGPGRRGPHSAPHYTFPWYPETPDGPAMAGRSQMVPPDGPARWSRQMVPPDGPAPQEMNRTERNGAETPAPAVDPTHGGRHTAGNPENKRCHVCRDERLADERRQAATPTPSPPRIDPDALAAERDAAASPEEASAWVATIRRTLTRESDPE